ncbi:hypothetical protein QWY93_14555 [Echinicola jeungdonensis]|uniref:Uncharacterized protein n=1 Tax=Echinicola jeungdonensis TaxID=709343 RepID=A0ABV5J9K3_9BACT|nr:hypothetical protein [Echinicola jeungdonensis]MDN3670541.1 hypothetical protein [Echinicola jeungdonensis]
MQDIVRIHVKLLIKGSDIPLSGNEYRVKFYDEDILKDDYLGESTLDDNGHAIFPITQKSFKSKDSPFEEKPDIYFTVEKYGQVIYKSKVFENLDLTKAGDYPVSGGHHIKLGTFLI